MKAIWDIIKTVAAKAAAKCKAIFTVVNWKDVGVRAVKTFFQAAFACITAAVADISFFSQEAAFKTLIISAISAGASAVWNGVVSPALKAMQEKADEEMK